MVVKKVVINIQAAGYNDMHTVYKIVAPWEVAELRKGGSIKVNGQ